MHGLAEVLAAIREGGCAVVAVVGEVVVGAAVTRVSGDRGWVVLFALAKDWRGRGFGSAMLTELEKQLMDRGVHRLSALLGEGDTGVEGVPELRLPATRTDLLRAGRAAAAAGGSAARASGRQDAARRAVARPRRHGAREAAIERRIVLPLVDPDLAGEYGVQPPRAVVLFGLPGRARRRSPRPSRPGSGGRSSRCFPHGWPPRTVVRRRRCARRSPRSRNSSMRSSSSTRWRRSPAARRRAGVTVQGITNELLKIIPAFRERTAGCSCARRTSCARWTRRSCVTAASTT